MRFRLPAQAGYMPGKITIANEGYFFFDGFLRTFILITIDSISTFSSPSRFRMVMMGTPLGVTPTSVILPVSDDVFLSPLAFHDTSTQSLLYTKTPFMTTHFLPSLFGSFSAMVSKSDMNVFPDIKFISPFYFYPPTFLNSVPFRMVYQPCFTLVGNRTRSFRGNRNTFSFCTFSHRHT